MTQAMNLFGNLNFDNVRATMTTAKGERSDFLVAVREDEHRDLRGLLSSMADTLNADLSCAGWTFTKRLSMSALHKQPSRNITALTTTRSELLPFSWPRDRIRSRCWFAQSALIQTIQIQTAAAAVPAIK